MNMKYFCGDILFWCACISHVSNLLCYIVLEKYKKLIEAFRGYPLIIVILFLLLQNDLRKENIHQIHNLFKSNHLQIFYKIGVLKKFTGIFLWILCNFSKSGNKSGSVNRTWEIFFFKNHAKNESGGLVSDLFPLKTFTKDKSTWLKLQVSRHETWLKETPAQVFFCEFHTFFPKNLFTEQFWMTASANSSVPTKVLYYDPTFFVFFLHFLPFIIDIVCKGIPAPHFLRHPPLDPASPPFLKSLFPLPPFLSPPFLRFPRPHATPSCRNLTNQPSLV